MASVIIVLTCGSIRFIKLSEVLGTTVNYLAEDNSQNILSELQDRELLHQFQQIEPLSEENKKVVKIFLEAFLTKRHDIILLLPR